MSVKISVTGTREIDQALKMMPTVLQHSTLGAAHLDAAKPLIEREKQLVPVDDGELRNSIGAIKTPIKKANTIGEVIIGPRRTRKFRGHHGHLVESGTAPRTNKGGANRGVMPAKPFVQPSFHQTKKQVIDRIAVSVGKKVYTTMRRYIKK